MVLIVLLLVAPVTVAERYTSPTQDGQFILDPLKSWGFVFTLLSVGGSSELGSSGDALREATLVFETRPELPLKVELLYLPDDEPYIYVTKAGQRFVIQAPPRLVWEVWGRGDVGTQPGAHIDVIGFLDYSSGRLLDLADMFAAQDH